MPRSNSRPTLKLPAKPANSVEISDLRPRKPVRGGFAAAKTSVAQHARRVAAKVAPLPLREAPSRKAESTSASSTPAPRSVPPRHEERAPLAPKVYPKRGIARSTGARALPPMRTEQGPEQRGPAFASATESPRFAPPEPERPAAKPQAPRPERTEVQATPPASEPAAPRRPLKEPPRLSKRVSEMTQCSRREADEWIENGWVRVDGVVVTTLGTRAHPSAKIEIKEEASKHQTESVTILLNKPLDAESESTAALSLITAENRWAEDETRLVFKATHLRGLALAGKLDAESTGMLVFTQEGSVARRITGDETRLEKEYMVRVEGELSPEGMKLLNFGLVLDEVKLKRAQVSWQNEQQLRFVLHESRKNQIQRMCELVGLRVTSIKRIRIGSVSLGKLPVGQWRYLRESERF